MFISKQLEQLNKYFVIYNLDFPLNVLLRPCIVRTTVLYPYNCLIFIQLSYMYIHTAVLYPYNCLLQQVALASHPAGRSVTYNTQQLRLPPLSFLIPHPGQGYILYSECYYFYLLLYRWLINHI